MSRYHALRHIGCDPITALFIAALNAAFGVPAGRAGLLNVVIEYDHKEPTK